MNAQPNLFPPGPALGNLTDKQQFVLDLLQQGGLHAIDVGRALHVEDGCAYCSPVRACRFAMPNASRILDSLGSSGRQLVIRRRSGQWELTAAARPHDTGTFPQSF